MGTTAGHQLTSAERDARNAKVRMLYDRIVGESGHRDAVAALRTRFGMDSESIRTIIKKEASR